MPKKGALAKARGEGSGDQYDHAAFSPQRLDDFYDQLKTGQITSDALRAVVAQRQLAENMSMGGSSTSGSMGPDLDALRDALAAATSGKNTLIDNRPQNFDPERGVQFQPMNPMCDAAEQGDLATLTQLIATGGDVNATGESGNSALAFACANGHADCTSLLISNNAKVDQPSLMGNTPLHAACWADSPKCMRILLDAKALVDFRSRSNGATPMSVAVQGNRAEAVQVSARAARCCADTDGERASPLPAWWAVASLADACASLAPVRSCC